MMSRMTSAPRPSVTRRTSSTKSCSRVVDRVRRRPAPAAGRAWPPGRWRPRSRRGPRRAGSRTCRCRCRRRAPAASRPCRSRATSHHVRPDRAGHLGQRGGVDQVDAGRHRQQLPGRHGHPLGVPAAGQQRADLARPPPSRSRPAPTALITPEHSSPGYGGRARRRRVVPLPLQQVGPVDRAGRAPRRSPRPGRAPGSGTSAQTSASGPPGSGIVIARMAQSYPIRSRNHVGLTTSCRSDHLRSAISTTRPPGRATARPGRPEFGHSGPSG